MSSPTDDDRNLLPELENDVEPELAEDQASEPAENPDGTPTEAWLEDPYLTVVGRDPAETYPGIAAHLAACGPCGEDFRGLPAAPAAQPSAGWS